MVTPTQLDLFTDTSLADPVPAQPGAAARPWLTFATVWQLFKLATSRLIVAHQSGAAATIAVAARPVRELLAAGKGTGTRYRLGVIVVPHTFHVWRAQGTEPVTVPAGHGLMVEYHVPGVRGYALFVDRAGVEERRWRWYWAKTVHVTLPAVPVAGEPALPMRRAA